jgi:hypothetical protein
LTHRERAQILGACAGGREQELRVSHAALKVGEVYRLSGASDYDVYVLCPFGWQPLGQAVGGDDMVVWENDDKRGSRSAPPLHRGHGWLAIIVCGRHLILVKNIIESRS